jgi:16S rRNA (cytosine967-C5)-methyltransferase
MTNARLAAARVLLAVEHGRTTLAAELDRARRDLADDRDRALLVELAAGVLRWRAALDARLSAQSHRPLSSLTLEVRTVLRIGAYQLQHLTRVPVHASVSESVELARALGEPRAAGFVNAVLRRVATRRRRSATPPPPDAGADRATQLEYLATTLSHPEWLAARWLDRHGFEAAAAWCEFNNRAPHITVRVRPPGTTEAVLAALTASGLSADPEPWVWRALRLPPGTLGRVPTELRGLLDVQDVGSQLVAHAVGATSGDRVLDACAAPGGKTMVMMDALAGRGVVVAADYRPARVRLLREILARASRQTPIVTLDARQPLPFGPVFDRVLLDAPCSGLGTLRRDPDLKWSRTEHDLSRFARDQRQMILNAADVVRPGGRLVYATCSSEPEENDAIVQGFLIDRPDFSVEPPRPSKDAPDLSHLVDPQGFLRTMPPRDALDAYFAAVLVRRQGA